MKRIVILGSLILLMGIGCQKNNNKQLTDRIAKLEKRIELLEKRLKAAPSRKAPEEQKVAYKIPVGESYYWGDKNAPITLTKFSDYQCPFCTRAHDGFVKEVMKDPELKNKVKIVFKHFPLSFHKQAKPASKAALAAGEQGSDCFWKMTDLLYKNQRSLTDENFKIWAEKITCKKKDGRVAKLDVKKFLQDYKNNDSKYEKNIAEDMNLGMKSANVRGTPSFYANGWKLGQRSVSALKQMIKDKKLATIK